jgi:hypothetical protein
MSVRNRTTTTALLLACLGMATTVPAQTTVTLQNGTNSYGGCTDLWLDMGNKSNTHATDDYLSIYGNGIY